MQENVLRTSDERGDNCDPAVTLACSRGCWFLYSASGCKQDLRCPYCHNAICCVLADMKRREFRREQSRQRPSKKKRERLNRCRIDTCSTESDPGKPRDLCLSVLLESTDPATTYSPPDNIRDIQKLMDMISRGS